MTSVYRRYVRVTDLMRRYPEVLRLFEKLNGKAESGDFSTTKDALCISHLDKAFLSKVDEYDLLLYIETAAAQT